MIRRKRNKTQEKFQDLHNTIAKKAYELYEKRSCQHGNDMADWFEAERIVKKNTRSYTR